MKFQCQITAQRKQRPLYFTSDEQFQWMIAIIQHFVPDINLDLEGLKAVGKSLGIEGPAPHGTAESPMRPLPVPLEATSGQDNTPSNPSENMSEKGGHMTEDDNEKDDETNALEGPLTMTDTTSQPVTPTPRRNSSYTNLLTFSGSKIIQYCHINVFLSLLLSSTTQHQAPCASHSRFICRTLLFRR